MPACAGISAGRPMPRAVRGLPRAWSRAGPHPPPGWPANALPPIFGPPPPFSQRCPLSSRPIRSAPRSARPVADDCSGEAPRAALRTPPARRRSAPSCARRRVRAIAARPAGSHRQGPRPARRKERFERARRTARRELQEWGFKRFPSRGPDTKKPPRANSRRFRNKATLPLGNVTRDELGHLEH